MSDKPISVGDLVQVVRGCIHCGDTGSLGDIFRVGDIEETDTPIECCGEDTPAMCAWPKDDDDSGYPLAILKRIPPLDEMEGVKTEEDIREPA